MIGFGRITQLLSDFPYARFTLDMRPDEPPMVSKGEVYPTLRRGHAWEGE